MNKGFATGIWFCLFLAGGLSCVTQFRTDHFWPFTTAALLFGIIWKFQPAWRRAVCAPATLALVTSIADAAFLHHRVGVTLRTWAPGLGGWEVVDVLPSPSGRSVAYVAVGGFVDASYRVYLSDGGVFPKHWSVETQRGDLSYPKDLAGKWNGPVFRVAGFCYDERDRRATPSS